jgi:DNA-directed RNA polymerase specialized sigma24 family protein
MRQRADRVKWFKERAGTARFPNGGIGMQPSARTSPAKSRTTCIYDAPARQILVTTPTGQTVTFPYDPGDGQLGVLAVSTARVTWTVDRGDKATGGAYRDANGGTDVMKLDACGNRRLANVDSARTTIIYDAAKPDPVGCAGAGRTRFVFEPEGSQPIVLVFLPISPEWCVYLAFLHVTRLQEQDNPDAAQKAFGEVLEHQVSKDILAEARRRVLNGVRDPGAWQDVPQDAYQRLMEWQKSRSLRYTDHGPRQFVGWLETVCGRACSKAWESELRWRRPDLALVETGPLAQMVAVPKWGRCRERLLAAINELPNPEARDILLEIIFRVGTEEAAKKRKISVGTMHSRRQWALEMLREADVDFPEYL